VVKIIFIVALFSLTSCEAIVRIIFDPKIDAAIEEIVEEAIHHEVDKNTLQLS
jgi:hypothetical protein